MWVGGVDGSGVGKIGGCLDEENGKVIAQGIVRKWITQIMAPFMLQVREQNKFYFERG